LIQKYEKSLGLENYGGLGLEIQSLGLGVGLENKVLFTSLTTTHTRIKDDWILTCPVLSKLLPVHQITSTSYG